MTTDDEKFLEFVKEDIRRFRCDGDWCDITIVNFDRILSIIEKLQGEKQVEIEAGIEIKRHLDLRDKAIEVANEAISKVIFDAFYFELSEIAKIKLDKALATIRELRGK